MKAFLLPCFLLITFSLFGQQPVRDISSAKGLTPITTNGQTTGTTYAVVVGISDYQDEDIPDLRFADKDAEAFAAFLQSPAGGSLDEDHIELLINEEATGGKMAAAFYWLIDEATEGDNVIIYFSGHGDVETKTMFQLGYLLNWDSPPDTYMAGAFNIRDLQAIISTLSERNKARVTLITDACRAGKLAGSSINGPQITNANLSAKISNEIKILSCQSDEYSIEGEQWGGGRGAFSYHLTNGLYGLADENEDRSVNLMELGRYLQDKVSEEVAPHNQMPQFVGNIREEMAKVHAVTLEQIKSKNEQQIAMFKATGSKGIEEQILSKADSTVQQLYADFNRALKEKRFLFPSDSCADVYYEQLIKIPELAKLHAGIRRNYAAALQDDAQQAINDKMQTEDSTCFVAVQVDIEKYKNYPAYLDRTIELLGEDHYMFPILRARRYYFEGYLMQMKGKENRTGYDPLVELELYQKALEYNPNMPLALLEVAYLKAFEFEQLDTAEVMFVQLLQDYPNWIYGYSDYIHFLENKRNDPKKSLEWIEKAYAIDSGSIVANHRFGEWHFMRGDFLKASYYFDRIKHKIKSSHCVVNLIFYVYMKLGKLHDLTQIMEKFQPEIDDDFRLKFFEGVIYAENHQYDKAESNFESLISRNPDAYSLNTNLGMVYIQQEKYEQAEQAFLKDYSLDSVGIRANVGLYILYLIQDRKEEAVQQMKEILKIDSTTSITLITGYVESINWGDTSKPVYAHVDKYFETLFEIVPENKLVNFQYARELAQQGALDTAFEHLKTAIVAGITEYDTLQNHYDFTNLREQSEEWDRLMKKYFPDHSNVSDK